MIVNLLSIVLLFLDTLSLALAAVLLAAALRSMRLATRGGESGGLEQAERSATLALTLALVLAGLRVGSWPLLYATLASFVPSIEGAMCVWGVTRARPLLSTLVEASKPLVVFLAGGWLLLDRLDRRTRISHLRPLTTALSAVLALAVLAEVPLEMALVGGVRATFVANCCTTVADVAARPTQVVPAALLGPHHQPALTVAFLALAALSAGLAAVAGFGAGLDRPGGRGRVVLRAALLVALLSLVPGAYAAVELIAPAWMGLPSHHCLYCWLVYRDAPLGIGAFALGVLALGWATLVEGLARADETAPFARAMARRLAAWAAFSLGAALVMTLVHLFAPVDPR